LVLKNLLIKFYLNYLTNPSFGQVEC
jgi:hypothetical protein